MNSRIGQEIITCRYPRVFECSSRDCTSAGRSTSHTVSDDTLLAAGAQTPADETDATRHTTQLMLSLSNTARSNINSVSTRKLQESTDFLRQLHSCDIGNTQLPLHTGLSKKLFLRNRKVRQQTCYSSHGLLNTLKFGSLRKNNKLQL